MAGVWRGGHRAAQPECHLSPAQVLFVVVDVAGYGAEVLPFFGMTPADAPTLRLVKMENNRKYQMEQDSFSDTAIRSFIQGVLDGRVKVREEALCQRALSMLPCGLLTLTPNDGSCAGNTITCLLILLLPGLGIWRGCYGKEAGRRPLMWRLGAGMVSRGKRCSRKLHRSNHGCTLRAPCPSLHCATTPCSVWVVAILAVPTASPAERRAPRGLGQEACQSPGGEDL